MFSTAPPPIFRKHQDFNLSRLMEFYPPEIFKYSQEFEQYPLDFKMQQGVYVRNSYMGLYEFLYGLSNLLAFPNSRKSRGIVVHDAVMF